MRIMKAAILVLALQAAVFAGSPRAASSGERLVYETDSLYHHIIVSENAQVRILRFHKGAARQALGSDFAQSVVLLSNPDALHMPYARQVTAGMSLATAPKHALFVGLGAGTLPKFHARAFPNCQVDVAELDGKVVDVAKEFFYLPDLPNLKVTVLDGRLFIKQAKVKYDLIMLDAYRDDMIPFHLMTLEFLEQTKAALAEGGLVVSNLAIDNTTQLYPWVLRTYQSVFGSVHEAAIPGTINKVLICKTAPGAIAAADLRAAAQALQARMKLDFDLTTLATYFRDVSMKQPSDKVLTDNYAPVNLMRFRKAGEKDWDY